MPVEGFFEGPQPGLSNSDLVPQNDLRVSPGAGILALVDVSHSRAGKDFHRATTKPGLSQEEKVSGSFFYFPVCEQLGENQEVGSQNAQFRSPDCSSSIQECGQQGSKGEGQRAVVPGWN